VRITEAQLRRIIRREIAASPGASSESLDEGLGQKLRSAALAAAIGLGSLFGGGQAHADQQGSKEVIAAAQAAQKELGYTRQDLKKVLASEDFKNREPTEYKRLYNIDKFADDLKDGGNAVLMFNLYLKQMPQTRKIVNETLGRR
jgi:uncharacterized protein HemX